MKWVFLISRILLGLIFTIFGATGFLYFVAGIELMPVPPPSPQMAQVFAGFMAMKYFLPLVKFIETIAGVFLLSNRFVDLALVLLAPIVVNILGIHLFVEPSGLPVGIIVVVLMVVQFYSRWNDFRPLLKTK